MSERLWPDVRVWLYEEIRKVHVDYPGESLRAKMEQLRRRVRDAAEGGERLARIVQEDVLVDGYGRHYANWRRLFDGPVPSLAPKGKKGAKVPIFIGVERDGAWVQKAWWQVLCPEFRVWLDGQAAQRDRLGAKVAVLEDVRAVVDRHPSAATVEDALRLDGRDVTELNALLATIEGRAA